MNDKLGGKKLLRPQDSFPKESWIEYADALEQQAEKWELEAKRLYGVGQDIEEMRVALEQRVEGLPDTLRLRVFAEAILEDPPMYLEEVAGILLAIAVENRSDGPHTISYVGENGPWWHRMSNEDIAAELSATFDLGLDTTRKIADWILKEEA